MKVIQNRRTEAGIALLTVLLFLLLLSGLAVGLMYMSTTDTQINANFRSEQQSYFAARAGMEEMRDRMRSAHPKNVVGVTASLPTSTNTVLYLLGYDKNEATIDPWSKSDAYFDTELCHDGYSWDNNSASTVNDLPCPKTANISGGTKNTVTGGSVLPFANTTAAIPFKWVRLGLKQGNSVNNYPVSNSAKTSSNVVCWNGTYELLGSGSTSSTCPSGSNAVYLITSLAVTNNNNQNAAGRKMVQAEVALQPSTPFNYGLFATGTGCGAVTVSGTANTDSFSSAGGGSYASTKQNTGGNVGTNGNVAVNGTASIGGSVASPVTPPVIGACPGSTMTVSGNGGMISNPNNTLQSIPTQVIPTPTIPATSGPNKSSPSTLSPGNYGNITLSGGPKVTLTLTSGTYNINSLSVTGQASIVISGAVTLNIQGTGVSGDVLDMEGGSVTNTSGLASNFIVNYAGTGTMKIAGGASTYVEVMAPNASLEMRGNSDIYGAIVAKNITISGTPAFHYDRSLSIPGSSPAYYTLIGYRELFY